MLQTRNNVKNNHVDMTVTILKHGIDNNHRNNTECVYTFLICCQQQQRQRQQRLQRQQQKQQQEQFSCVVNDGACVFSDKGW